MNTYELVITCEVQPYVHRERERIIFQDTRPFDLAEAKNRLIQGARFKLIEPTADISRNSRSVQLELESLNDPIPLANFISGEVVAKKSWQLHLVFCGEYLASTSITY